MRAGNLPIAGWLPVECLQTNRNDQNSVLCLLSSPVWPALCQGHPIFGAFMLLDVGF